jgi:hypothetical protein
MIGLGNRIPSSQNPVTASIIQTTAGLQAWYQFNTGISYSGSNVTSWSDSSGNNNNLTQTTATNQGIKTSPLGGVHLDGTDNFMALDTAIDLTTFTVFAAITLDDNSLETLFGNGSDNTDMFRVNGSAWLLRTNTASFQGSLATAKGTSSFVVTLFSEVGASSTKYTLRSTGEGEEDDVSIDNQTFTIGDIGRLSSGAQFFDGKVLEVAIYNTELSQATMEAIETDIVTRTGI